MQPLAQQVFDIDIQNQNHPEDPSTQRLTLKQLHAFNMWGVKGWPAVFASATFYGILSVTVWVIYVILSDWLSSTTTSPDDLAARMPADRAAALRASVAAFKNYAVFADSDWAALSELIQYFALKSIWSFALDTLYKAAAIAYLLFTVLAFKHRSIDQFGAWTKGGMVLKSAFRWSIAYFLGLIAAAGICIAAMDAVPSRQPILASAIIVTIITFSTARTKGHEKYDAQMTAFHKLFQDTDYLPLPQWKVHIYRAAHESLTAILLLACLLGLGFRVYGLWMTALTLLAVLANEWKQASCLREVHPTPPSNFIARDANKEAVKEWFQKNNIAFYHVEWC